MKNLQQKMFDVLSNCRHILELFNSNVTNKYIFRYQCYHLLLSLWFMLSSRFDERGTADALDGLNRFWFSDFLQPALCLRIRYSLKYLSAS